MVHVTWGILVACGATEQLAPGADIAFLSPSNNPMISYSLSAFERCADIDGVAVVVAKDKLEVVANMVRLFGCTKVRRIVAGTARRQSSIVNALKVVDDAVSLVSIHDVSRPCATPELISETVRAAKRYGSGVAAVRVQDSIKEVEKGQTAKRNLDRSRLWATQTPQTFRRDLLEKGLEAANRKKIALDDDSHALGVINEEIHLVPSSTSNMKVRSADDMVLVAALLRVL